MAGFLRCERSAFSSSDFACRKKTSGELMKKKASQKESGKMYTWELSTYFARVLSSFFHVIIDPVDDGALQAALRNVSLKQQGTFAG